MKRFYALTAGLALAVMGFAPQAGADEVTEGFLVTSSCFACHSVDGTGNMPNLTGGYPPELIVSQMLMFKDGSRPGTIMNRIAIGYTEEQIAQMGAYFAKFSAQ